MNQNFINGHTCAYTVHDDPKKLWNSKLPLEQRKLTYVYSTIHLFSKYLVRISCVSGLAIAVKKIDRAPALWARASALLGGERK